MNRRIARFLHNSQCPYQTLGLSRNATQEQIKKTYFELAKKYHPDLHPQNPVKFTQEIFKRINEAYSALSSQKGNSAQGTYSHPNQNQQQTYRPNMSEEFYRGARRDDPKGDVTEEQLVKQQNMML